MSRSERYLPRHARGQSGGPRPRHASPLTAFRRWRNRHERGGAPQDLPRRLASAAGWALLLAGSVLVFVLAWQLIGDRVSSDSGPPAGQVQRHQAS